MPTIRFLMGNQNSVLDYILNVFSFLVTDLLNYYLVLVLGSFAGLCFIWNRPLFVFNRSPRDYFSANHIGLLDAGHLTKIATLGFIPVVLAGSYQLYQRKWIPGFVVLSFGFGALINRNHIQMAYLAAIALAVFVIAACLKFIKKRLDIPDKISGIAFRCHAIGRTIELRLLTGLKTMPKTPCVADLFYPFPNAKSADINTASGEMVWAGIIQCNGQWTRIYWICGLQVPSAVPPMNSGNQSELGRMFRASGGKDVKLPDVLGEVCHLRVGLIMSIIILYFLIGLVTIKDHLNGLVWQFYIIDHTFNRENI